MWAGIWPIQMPPARRCCSRALGALRDIDFGIYPLHHLLNVIGAYAPIGAGIPGHKLHNSISVMKALLLRGRRPLHRRAGHDRGKHALREKPSHGMAQPPASPAAWAPIDLVASRYGVFCRGCDGSSSDPAGCAGLHGKDPHGHCCLADRQHYHHPASPMGEALDTAQPVVEYLPGWHCDITTGRKWEDLPQQTRDYVEYLEKAV